MAPLPTNRKCRFPHWAYIGFDAVSTAAQEITNPRRDMPIGILGSLAICMAIYVAVGFVQTGIVSFDRLDAPSPIAVAIDAVGIRWFGPVIELGIIFGLTSGLLAVLLAQPRVFRAIADDGLLPRRAAKIHPKLGTTCVATIWIGIVVAILVAVFPISFVAELVSIGILFAFVIVCFGVLVLPHPRESGPRSS
jgi:basic amino acid/polyamine antiporter, APA family